MTCDKNKCLSVYFEPKLVKSARHLRKPWGNTEKLKSENLHVAYSSVGLLLVPSARISVCNKSL